MSSATLAASVSRRIDALKTTGAALAVFAGTIFLSALLLFSVQPMFAKMVLPKLGGSPSVWAVSMCFFQAALLGGYCYAHAVNRWLPTRIAPLVHLTLLALAMLALPIGLPAFGQEPPAGDAYLWLIGVLAVGVGLPFFAVSANAPLLQAWFARSGHPHAADPYFLYAASNLGSLIALLAYPLLIEPASGAAAQANVWTVGFVGLAVAIAACAMLLMAGQPTTSDAAHPLVSDAPAPTWAKRAEWVGLAFVPSGLLVAFSTYVSTDIASAPLLWVLPLAWFLLTFVVTFRDRPLLPHAWMLRLQTVFVGTTLLGLAFPGGRGHAVATVASVGAFLVSTLVAHRELYVRRPAASGLTGFYLWMSLGGMLGGVFAAIASPQLFSSFWELPLLLVLGMLCRPGLAHAWRTDASRSEACLMLAAIVTGCVVYAVLLKAGAASPLYYASSTLALVTLVYAVAARETPVRQLAALVAAFSGLVILPSAMNQGDSMRSFFGVHRVAELHDGKVRGLFHGTTLHGSERLLDAEGRKVAAAQPATYYHRDGPMAKGLEAARAATDKAAVSVGIVGLGAGSMACHARTGDRMRFYEIDPTVVRIARDPARFTYLTRCLPHAEIVLGDARLTLTKAPDAGYDYLLVDAFSSDAVPAHLLSVEALRLYLSKITPNGLLALHVSNRHLDLVSVVSSLVAAVPGTHAVLAYDKQSEPMYDRLPSMVVFIARREAALEPVRAQPFTIQMPKAVVAPWTDDYSDVLGAMLRQKL